MDLSQYAELFRAEPREHLSTFNQLLLEWERAPDKAEPVDGIFRAVHTIKGMAATMGYAAVADLAHRAETLLDHCRRQEDAVSPDVLELMFRTADGMEELVWKPSTRMPTRYLHRTGRASPDAGSRLWLCRQVWVARSMS